MFDTTTWFALNRRIVIAAKLFSGQFKIKDEEMVVRRKKALRTNWRSANIGPSHGNSRL